MVDQLGHRKGLRCGYGGSGPRERSGRRDGWWPSLGAGGRSFPWCAMSYRHRGRAACGLIVRGWIGDVVTHIVTVAVQPVASPPPKPLSWPVMSNVPWSLPPACLPAAGRSGPHST